MPVVTVVFDLDGTLVDTAPDLIDALNVVLGNEGLPPVPFAQARLMIGGGARRSTGWRSSRFTGACVAGWERTLAG